MSGDREHRLELSLRNCLALARRMQSKDPDAWGHVIRFCREADIEPSILREAAAAVTPAALSEAMRHAATLLQSKGLAPKTVVVDLVRHLGALRKCVERTRTLDDCGAESGSSWQSPDLESNIEAADKALAFFFDLFGVPLEAK